MSISNYVRPCGLAKSGLNKRIFVAPFPTIGSATFSNDELTALTMTGGTFSELVADFNSVSWNSEGTTSRISSHEATLTAHFTGASSQFTKLLNELKATMNCGLVIIFQNGSGKWFVSGIDKDDFAGASIPFRTLNHNWNSGEGVADEEGDLWTLEFVKESGGVEFYELDSDLSTQMRNGTATFVNWI